MIPRSPACLLSFALVACVPAQPHDPGGPSRADSDADSGGPEDTHTGDTDTGDTEAVRTCADLPWKQVELGWDFGCGIHTDGCVECWGSDTLHSLVYDEPEVEAAFIAVNDQPYHDYENREDQSACVIGTDQQLTCWAMHSYHVVHQTTEPVVGVAFGDFTDLAVLFADGSMIVQTGDWVYPPVFEVAGPMSLGNIDIHAARGGRLVSWRTLIPDLEEADHGAVNDWSWYGPCGGSWCGLTDDGAGWILSFLDGWVQLFPSGSGWVAIWDNYSSYLVQDSAGFVYDFDDTTGVASPTPWFTEPVVSVSSVQSASCGITADGWLECTGDMKDLYPPPGSYVLPR